MRIGIDMDSTLIINSYAWSAYYDKFMEEHGHSERHPAQAPTWDYVYNLCPVCFRNVVLDKDVLMQSILMPGAKAALQELRRFSELWLISHRDPSLTLTGIQLLKKLDVYDLFASYDWSFTPKLETLRKYGISVLVDDSPKNIAELEGTEITPIIFDQPYNGNIPGIRAYSWADVPRLVRESVACPVAV